MFICSRFPVLVVMLLLGGGASVAKSSGLFIQQVRYVEGFLGGSQYLHLIIAATLSFFTVWATLQDSKKYVFNSVGSPSFCLVFLVAVDEFSQLLLPNRTYSLVDLSINFCGIVIGSVLYIISSLIIDKKKNSRYKIL